MGQRTPEGAAPGDRGMLKALAAVQTAARSIELRLLDVPATLAPGEALLRVEACGMCGSDAEQYRSGPQAYQIPYTTGHNSR